MSIPNPQFEAACGVISTLRAAGYEAYLAGGCVRDLLLGREPADYDVATSATPDLVLEMFRRTFAVGAHFGAALGSDGVLFALAAQIERARPWSFETPFARACASVTPIGAQHRNRSLAVTSRIA